MNDYLITEESKKLLINDLDSLNAKRVRDLSFIIIALSFILLILDFYNWKKGLWNNQGYFLLFITHIILFCFSVIFFLINNIHLKNSLKNIYTKSFCFILLNICAFTSGYIDQKIHGQITVYLLGVSVISILFYFKPKTTLFMYLQSYIFFVINLLITQPNKDILQGHLGNSFIIVVIFSFAQIQISKLMYRDRLHNNNLEFLVKKRTEELLEKEHELSRLQQFHLIGEMAAGIAHEIRNPMTTVRGFLQMLGAKDYYQRDKSHFDLMIEELDRANSIITEYLSLAKDRKVTLKNENLNAIIYKVAPLIESNVKYNQMLKLDLQDIPDLFLDVNEIRRLILNLTNNGIEAMPYGGCLTIKTYEHEGKVILEVKDQGVGIDPSIIKKIGTPFFTTKDNGTGLGLALCYDILNKHGGKLEIESSTEGSTFRAIFNISAKE